MSINETIIFVLLVCNIVASNFIATPVDYTWVQEQNPTIFLAETADLGCTQFTNKTVCFFFLQEISFSMHDQMIIRYETDTTSCQSRFKILTKPTKGICPEYHPVHAMII